MKVFAIPSVLTLLLLNSNIGTSHADEEDVTKEIVGGTEVVEGRYPYQVALVDDSGSPGCGGSLIATNYVLTAAHCACSFTNVIIGRHDFSDDDETFENIPIALEIQHPDYNCRTTENDIMVIELESASSFAAVTLDEGSADLSEGTDVTVMGWGTTSSGGSPSDVLLEVEVDIVSNANCNTAYNGGITSDMLCASRLGKDSCQGDSGGPLIVKGSDEGSDVQVGVVSWGTGCADPDFPGVYARVAEKLDWINAIMMRKTTELDKLKYKAKKMFNKKKSGRAHKM